MCDVEFKGYMKECILLHAVLISTYPISSKQICAGVYYLFHLVQYCIEVWIYLRNILYLHKTEYTIENSIFVNI